MALCDVKYFLNYRSNFKLFSPFSAFYRTLRDNSKYNYVQQGSFSGKPVSIQSNRNAHFQFHFSRTFSLKEHSKLSNIVNNCVSRRQCSSYSDSTEKSSLLSLCPTKFVDFLKSNKISRCYFVWDDSQNKVVASHPELQEIEDWLNDGNNPFYLQHEALFLYVGMRSNCLMGAFLWNVNRGQACGGIRMIPFTSVEHYIREGLRLSRRLGVKAALAGLWVGGGKGLILEPKDRQHIQPDFRQKIFYDYGDFISSLNGCFIAGMDTGVNAFDLYNIHTHTRWVVSGPEDIGGSGNAAVLLGRGIICAMEAALNFLGAGSLSGMKVAVQGAGGIGLAVTSGLLDKGASLVYVTDTSKKSLGDLHDALIHKVARGRLKVEKVNMGDKSILGRECDILSPCAVGHVFTPHTILDIKAKIVCGSANALLESEEDAKYFSERGVTYVPEYIPNRMAFVNSANENYGRIKRDPAIERHFDPNWEHSIYCLTQKTLRISSEQGVTVMEATNRLAEDYTRQKHPVWPDRTRTIVRCLVEGKWHQGQDFWRKRRNFAKSDDWTS